MISFSYKSLTLDKNLSYKGTRQIVYNLKTLETHSTGLRFEAMPIGGDHLFIYLFIYLFINLFIYLFLFILISLLSKGFSVENGTM